MKSVKKIFSFYVNSSIHVGVSTLCLVILTYAISNSLPRLSVCGMVFFGTVFSYNYIKYYSFFNKKSLESKNLKVILIISVISFIISVVCFLYLNIKAQVLAVFFALLTFFYIFPTTLFKKNLRSFSGIKIYIVSFCWAGVTLLIPLVNNGYDLTTDIGYKFLQRFLITLILILIFEIQDLKEDDLALKTVPQTIGVVNTKKLILLLCIPFYFLEFLKIHPYTNQWIVNLILVIVILLFTRFASPNRSKYYTLFWVEAIPILWLILFLLLKTN